MKAVKDLTLMGIGAMMALLIERYGNDMLDMASCMITKKKCPCEELDD